jgi:hypothetical protein
MTIHPMTKPAPNGPVFFFIMHPLLRTAPDDLASHLLYGPEMGLWYLPRVIAGAGGSS